MTHEKSASKGDIEYTDSRNIKLRLLLKHHQKFMHSNLSLIAMLFWWFSIYLLQCYVDFNGEQLFDTTTKYGGKYIFDMSHSWCFFVALVWWGEFRNHVTFGDFLGHFIIQQFFLFRTVSKHFRRQKLTQNRSHRFHKNQNRRNLRTLPITWKYNLEYRKIVSVKSRKSSLTNLK